jgi:ABC-type Fe3+-hydroxamate transport system substrate-binding protein
VRVVSLVPSVTETLLAWGLEPVGVTRFCEQPGLRAVGGTKDPDVGAIVALAPDLVVVNDEENRREDADALIAAGLAVHVTHVHSVDDVGPCLHDLAAAVGAPAVDLPSHPAPAASTVTTSHGVQREPERRGQDGGGRRAFVPIWRRPWMTMNADTYGSSVLAVLGIVNVFGDEAERYPSTTLADAAARQPELVLAPTEPYPFKERHLQELRTVASDARLVDGQDLFWWGVRTPDALDRLRQSIGA